MEVYVRQSRDLAAKLKSARATLIHVLESAGAGDDYATAGVDVHKTTREAVDVEVSNEVLDRLGLLDQVPEETRS